MNVYDEAHSLAKAIKESDEFKEYDATKKKVDENPELAKMLADFQGKQLELQTKQMMGEEMGPEMMESIQTLYTIIMKNPVAAEHMQNEMRFSMMMNDVYQILGDAMGMGSFLKGGDN